MNKRVLFITIMFFFNAEARFALDDEEESAPVANSEENGDIREDFIVFRDRELTEEDNPFRTPEETVFKNGLRYSVLIGVPVVVAAYGFEVWDWGEASPRFHRERWFQADASEGGADKTGHFLAHYMVARMSYSVFSYTENSRNRALSYSAVTAFIVGSLIEIGDAFTGAHGFSHEDWIANNLGILAAVLLDKYPVLDQFLDFKGHYWPSAGQRKRSGRKLVHFPGDYSGWTYLMSLKPAGFRYLGYDIPEYLRFIQLDIGYYTRDYTNRDRLALDSGENLNPTRNWFFGISVNMREVAGETFRHNRKASWLAEQPFKYYHVPLGYTNDNRI